MRYVISISGPGDELRNRLEIRPLTSAQAVVDHQYWQADQIILYFESGALFEEIDQDGPSVHTAELSMEASRYVRDHWAPESVSRLRQAIRQANNMAEISAQAKTAYA